MPFKVTAWHPSVAAAVYAWTMDSQIVVTQCELLSLSPDVRNRVCEATSNQHTPQTNGMSSQANQHLLDTFASIEVVEDSGEEDRHEAMWPVAMPAMYLSTISSLTPLAATPVFSSFI